MTADQPNDPSTESTARPPRRKRYKGLHPRQFDERYKEQDPAVYPEVFDHVLAQGRTPAGSHVPILLNEVMEHLIPQPSETVVDCTIGYGGHAVEFLRRITPTGRLIGCDLDGPQLERTRQRLSSEGWNPDLHRMHFAGLAKLMSKVGIDGFDVIFADLGLSSMQIDNPARGFSYKHDGPLDMRMDDRHPKSAANWLAELTQPELSKCLHELADEPDHEKIARAIIRHRETQPITATRQLVKIIFEAKGLSQSEWRKQRELSGPALHPAALTFQALRILVNDELNGLAQFLRIAPHCLKPAGRIGVMSFHSGEDRLVKKSFRDGLRRGLYDSISETPVRSSPAERRMNPRSTSAKFRWAIRAE